jgi:arylsulfatase A-like enzyme/tetratricopeptide (TPR) repeat protein
MTRWRPSSAALVAAMSVLAGGCGRGPGGLSLPKAPVFLISVDTLRADHLPAYGYTGVETPHIDALRKDSVLFSNAYSQVPLTLPSHTTLMTGRLPADHGVRDNVGYRRKPTIETLAEVLRRNGYATGAAVSSIVLAGESGMKDGFERYDDSIEASAPAVSLGRVQRDGDETRASLTQWIATVEGRPLLGFLHLYEPHTPYEPPEPHRSRYASRPYDGEIARADEIVGTFLDFLRRRGLYDGALIVFLSDHGEGLGDHGEDEHGVFLYRQTLHVPLLVKLPGQARAGGTVADPVGLDDVFPTILAAVGAFSTATPKEVPPRSGVSLVGLLFGQKAGPRRIFSETVFPRLHYGWSDLASLFDGRHHYIEAPRPELFDTVDDPAETKDLAGGLPPAFRSLRVEMSRLRAATVESPNAVDPEQAAKLASLGYIGSTAAAADAKDLPDPKDKAGTMRAMKQGYAFLGDGRYPEAVAAFRALVKSEPLMADVWSGLAQALRKLGYKEEALAALKEVAKLSPPGSTDHFLGIAALALEIRRFDDATKHAELARDAGNSLAHETLAGIALGQRDFPRAEMELAEALRLHPERRFPRLIEARLRIGQGRFDEALAALGTIADSKGTSRKQLMTYHQLRADALARLGKTAEAVAEFEKELTLYPENIEAYQSLAILYATEARPKELYGTLERLLQATPTPPGYLAAARVLETVGDARGAGVFLRRGAAKFPGDGRFAGTSRS